MSRPAQTASHHDGDQKNQRHSLCLAAVVTLQEKESQALEFGNSLSSSTTASASLMLGIVSKARRSGPAAAKLSVCGRCQALRSSEEMKIKQS